MARCHRLLVSTVLTARVDGPADEREGAPRGHLLGPWGAAPVEDDDGPCSTRRTRETRAAFSGAGVGGG